MSKGQQNLKIWLAKELELRGRGVKVALAEFLGVTPDVVTRMLSLDTGKKSRRIGLEELPKIHQFLKDHPAPGREASAPTTVMARREAMHITVADLAKLASEAGDVGSVTSNEIAGIEAGVLPLSEDWRAAIGRVLQMEPGNLIGAELTASPARRIPLLGKIPASGWRNAPEDPTALIFAVEGGPDTFALTPDGDSMDRVAAPGSIVLCDPGDKALVPGKFYAAMKDDELTFKQYLDAPPRLAPASTNPQHKEMLLGEELILIVGRIIAVQTRL